MGKTHQKEDDFHQMGTFTHGQFGAERKIEIDQPAVMDCRWGGGEDRVPLFRGGFTARSFQAKKTELS